MSSVKVYGESDDRIEINGSFREEFEGGEAWKYLHFDDGTVIKVGFDLVEDKGWHIAPVRLAPSAFVEYMKPEMDMDEARHFSDVLQVQGNFNHIEVWDNPEGPDKESMIEWLLDLDRDSVRGITHENILLAYRALNSKESASET